MPRIRKTASPEADAARKAVKAYLNQSGRSLNALANELGIQQPTLYKFVRGFTKEITEKVRPAVSYANTQIEVMRKTGVAPDITEASGNRIRMAVLRVCRADPAATETMVRLVEAMSKVLARADAKSKKRQWT